MTILTSFKTLTSHLTHSQSLFHSSTLLIELFSSLQILSSIIITISLSSSPSHTLIKSLQKNLSLLTVTFQPSQPSIYIQPLWFLCIVYLVFHLLFLLHVLLPVFHMKKPYHKLTRILSSLYLLHSRIIFFPIQSLLLNHAGFYQESSSSSFYSHFGWLTVSILMLGLNFSFAFFKEFLVYRLNHTQNHYDVKTNLYHQATLIYKTLALVLCYFAQQGNITVNRVSALLHLFASVFLLIILYIKLPFYSFKMLKMTIIMSAIAFCLSFICAIFVLSGHNHKIQGAMQILLPFLPIMGIKLAFLQFRALFMRILKRKFRFPEHAIHFALLLEELTLDPDDSSIQCNKGLFPCIEKVVGVITGQNINLSKLKEDNEERERLSLFIMEILENTTFTSKSKIFLLYTAQFYLEKLDNIPKALEAARKLENNKTLLTSTMKNSLEYIYEILENSKENQDHLELSKYFRFYELTNKIKKEILTETNKHIEMWKDMTKQEWNINKIRAQAEDIDTLSHKVHKEISLHKNEFKRNFNTPMLLYAIYLNNIREMRQEAGQILVTCQASIENQKVSNEYDNILGTKAIVIISLEKNKVGQILDASGSLHNLFNFRKAEIIGKRFGCLFPGFIAQKYQQIIQQYAKTPVYKFDLNEETLGKGSNDEIFKLQVSFQLHPYMNKEITIMIQLQKFSDSLPLLIANHEGIITEYSAALKTIFHKEESINLTILKSIQCLSPVMESTNTAFNIHYGNNPRNNSPSKTSQPPQSSLDRIPIPTSSLAQSSLYTGIEEDTLVAVNNSSRSLIRVTEVSDRVKIYPRASPILQMTQSTAEQTCHKFIEGRRLLISSFNPSPLYKKYRLRANFQITPHILENNVYKVISVTDLARDATTFKEENFDSSDSVDTLADDFPFTPEGVHYDVPIFKKEKSDTSTYSSAELLFLPVQRIPFQRKKEHRETTFVNSTNKAVKRRDSQSDINTELNKMQLKIKELRKKLDKNNLYSTYQEAKNIEAIKDITTNKKIHPALSFLQFLLYTCFISLILLAGIEFSLAQSSIKETQAEVKLINTATLRLQAALSAWQWSLALFINSAIPISTSLAVIKESALNLTIYNNQLKAQIATIDNRELIDRAFFKDVRMGELPVQGDDNVNVLDSFTATDILVNQYLGIAEQNNLNKIKQIPTVLFTINNTANDYLSSSLKLKNDIDLALQKKIPNDIFILNSVLISQIFVFFALGALLVIMSGVVCKTYKKLFTALKRIQDIHIMQRLDRLKKTQQFFEDDIERKSFLQDSFALFIQEPSLKTPKKSTQNKSKTINNTMLKRHLFKSIGFALISILALIGLCIVALQKSISLFHSLSNINDHVSLLSSACFQSNVVLSNLIFAVLLRSIPGVLINNQIPFTEANRTLNQFNRLNEKLIGTFLQGETVDPFIHKILQESVCDYLDPYGKSACNNATNHQDLGLLGMNTEYYNVLNRIVVAIEAGASSSYLGALISSSMVKLSGERVALGRIYLVMIDHIMEEFDEMTQKSLNEEIVYFVVILLVIVVYGGFVCGRCLEGLKKMDLGRRRVLKVIPYQVIQENKAFMFYLVRNFGKEARDLRNSF